MCPIFQGQTRSDLPKKGGVGTNAQAAPNKLLKPRRDHWAQKGKIKWIKWGQKIPSGDIGSQKKGKAVLGLSSIRHATNIGTLTKTEDERDRILSPNYGKSGLRTRGRSKRAGSGDRKGVGTRDP